jgi:FkbM family methyltransferase
LKKYAKAFTRIYWKKRFFPDSLGVISKRIILSYLPTNPIILEAGAHIGIDSEYFAKRFKRSQIFALEPVPELFQKLGIRMSGYSNCKLFQIGLADFSGSSRIHLSSGASDGSSSLLIPKEHFMIHPEVKFEAAVDIQVQTLDDFLLTHNIEAIDLLWLDIQGLEPAVLRKSYKALRKIKLIHTEVNFIENYTGAELFGEFNFFLKSQGFKLLKLNKDYKDAGNALYLNNSFSHRKNSDSKTSFRKRRRSA